MDAVVVVIAGGLFALSVASGMLGLGVAFAAVPLLGFFLPDLVHQVQPLGLFLNGVTALFAAFGFARSRLVEWRPAILLTIVAAIAAPWAPGWPSTRRRGSKFVSGPTLKRIFGILIVAMTAIKLITLLTA